MKKVLFVARSYQMLMAVINLTVTLYKTDVVDLLWTNDSRGSEEIYTKIKSSQLFNKCTFLRHEEFAKEESIKDKLDVTLSVYFRPERLLEDYIDDYYDEIYIYNINRKLENAVFTLCKKKNNNLNFYLYEEGVASYLSENGYQNALKGKLKIICNIHKWLSLLTRRGPSYKKARGMYFYAPELIQFKPSFELLSIPVWNKENDDFKKIINNLFNLNEEECRKQYHKKYIYFEQSTLGDKQYEIIKNMVEIVGAENVLVKLHPRTTGNPYENLGIEVNKTVGVPWEAIQLNLDCKEKVFITVESSVAFNSLIYFNENTKAIMLYRCVSDNHTGFMNPTLLHNYVTKIKEIYPNGKIMVPENDNQFRESIYDKENN